jgi:hypothetical protein
MAARPNLTSHRSTQFSEQSLSKLCSGQMLYHNLWHLIALGRPHVLILLWALESSLVLLEFSGVEYNSLSMYLLISWPSWLHSRQKIGDPSHWWVSNMLWGLNTGAPLQNIQQGFKLSSYILQQPTNMCCVSSNYLLTWSPLCLSYFLLWLRCTFSLLPNLGRCLWRGICPCS